MNEEILNQYIDSLKKRLERIDTLATKLADGNSMAEDNIRLLGHSLSGSGGTFGFPEISEAGKAVEHADKAELADKLKVLKSVLEKIIAGNPGAAGAPKEKSPAPKPDAAPEHEPAAVKPAAPASDEGEENKVNKILDILVVDDDPDLVDLITRSLGGLPKKPDITVASTAAEAQEFLVKGLYDLIVLDLLLPDRDGREIIQEIKGEFQLKTPLLVISSIQSDGVRVECMSLGADKYLTKPFFEEDLLGEVKKLLGKKAQKKLALVPLDGEKVEEENDAEEENDGEEDRPGVLEGQNILVVDDEKSIANLVKSLLVNEGAAVKQAANGREAMQELRSQEFSLVILDVKMPIMDGFEVLQRIKGELKLEVPVIMVTAMGSEDDIIRGYDLGVTDYILKPFSEPLLMARVKSLLTRKRPG